MIAIVIMIMYYILIRDLSTKRRMKLSKLRISSFAALAACLNIKAESRPCLHENAPVDQIMSLRIKFRVQDKKTAEVANVTGAVEPDRALSQYSQTRFGYFDLLIPLLQTRRTTSSQQLNAKGGSRIKDQVTCRVQ